MKKYLQCKLDGTDKLVLHSLQHQIQNDDCFSELQEKENVNFLKVRIYEGDLPENEIIFWRAGPLYYLLPPLGECFT